MAWTAERVLEQSRRWVSPWYPRTATKLTVDGYEFSVVGRDATLMSFRGSLPTAEAVPGAVDVARGLGAEALTVTVAPDAPRYSTSACHGTAGCGTRKSTASSGARGFDSFTMDEWEQALLVSTHGRCGLS